MTEAPPPTDTPEPPETPLEERAKRTLVQAILFFGGIGLAVVLGLVVVTLVGGRMYLLSDSGRDLVTTFIAGKRVGSYGEINVEGVRGDLFDDFTIARVTVTDAEGVWLEAEEVRVDWNWIPLIGRRFHATDVEAKVIRLLRRPLVETTDEPPGEQPISVDIDKFAAVVELHEGFSQEYGRWRLTGDADVPRRGVKVANVNAYSLNRPGDFLRAAARIGDGLEELDINLRAREAQGGPIAGALGYSPSQPFLASIVVNHAVVDAVVRTGDFTPLTIKGGFGAEGSQVSGYVDFSGSDLFEPFVQRIGQTARFGFATVPDARREGFHGIAWRLTSENLTSTAQGLVRIEDRTTPDGTTINVFTPSATRLAGVPVGGAAAYRGVFSGGGEAWTLDGSVDLLNADLASYRAQRIRGPVKVTARAGRYDIDADVTAAGGAGEGLIGGLLGPAPRVQMEAARLPDGALLLERVDARGRGLTLTGSGGRALNGGLRFRGDATITDLARIQPGARGQFGGAITAASARPGAPWSITFDGRGRRMAIGMDELDRLLGPQPRLQLAGLLNGGRIELNTGRLTGAQGQASARGLIEGNGAMRLALDWTARGPFGVGPVAIDGAMSGEGAVTGTFAQPRIDLRAAFDRISAGALNLTQADLILSFRKGADASDGRVSLTAGSNYGPAVARGNFFLGGDRLRLSDVDLNAGGLTARGDVSLANNFPSSADLSFTARPGAFLASGQAEGRIRLTEGAGAETAILDVTGANVSFAGSTMTIRTLELNGRGTLDRLPFTLKADVGGDMPAAFDGTGVYSRTSSDAHTLTLQGAGRVREVAFTTRSPVILALAGEGRVARLDLNVGGGVLNGELRQDDRAITVNADLTAVELGSIAPDLRGQVTGRLAVRGQGDDLSGTASMALANLRSIDAPRGLAVDGSVEATLSGDVLRIVASARDEGAVTASADVSLPVEASAAPLRLAIARTRDMSGQVQIQGQVQPIWDLFLGGERSLAGEIDANARLGGTLNAPRINGRMDLRRGSFHDRVTGLRLGDVTLASRFDDTTALIETFNANDGSGGTVSGDGRLDLREGSGSSFQLALARFKVIDNDLAEARASGPLTVVRGTDGNIQLEGQIDIDEARIEANPLESNGIVSMDVVEINRPGGDPDTVERERAPGPSIGMNIRIRSPRGDVRIVGRGLNVEMGVNAQVGGTVSQPTLSGTARVVRGDYEFAGRRFVFDERGTVTLSTDPSRIRLDLSATREDPALTATIRITGTAARPEIALTSIPALPQDEILSQVLFGRSASQLSGFEAAQLAASVAALAGGGGFDVIGNLRELAGLDRLSFGGEASALTVAGGRYITDDVYLEIIGGGEGGAAVSVEWQVRRNLTVSSKFGGQGDASLSIRWRRQDRVPGGREDRRRNR